MLRRTLLTRDRRVLHRQLVPDPRPWVSYGTLAVERHFPCPTLSEMPGQTSYGPTVWATIFAGTLDAIAENLTLYTRKDGGVRTSQNDTVGADRRSMGEGRNLEW